MPSRVNDITPSQALRIYTGHYPLIVMLFSVASIAIIIYRLGLVPGLKIHIFTDEQVQDKRIIRVAQVHC
jgi:hypothetical protein